MPYSLRERGWVRKRTKTQGCGWGVLVEPQTAIGRGCQRYLPLAEDAERPVRFQSLPATQTN